MRQTHYKYDPTTLPIQNGLNVVEYSSLRDFMNTAKKGCHRGYNTDADWAGGTFDEFERGLTGRVHKFIKAADTKTQHFANVALESRAIEYDYNVNYGVLDYSALVAGNPACMYGATIEESDRSPVNLYIDTWTSATVSASNMTRRGIGILALVQALQVYRPVNVYFTKGSKFSPKKMNTLQIMALPTQPMDLARATFLMCSPTVNRWGMLAAIQEVYKTGDYCPSPTLSNVSWQENDLPKWVADMHGVTDYLFMPRTFDKAFWNNDEKVIGWIGEMVDKFVGKINA